MRVKSMAISGTDLLEVPTIYKAYFSGLCKEFPLIKVKIMEMTTFNQQHIPTSKEIIQPNGAPVGFQPSPNANGVLLGFPHEYIML